MKYLMKLVVFLVLFLSTSVAAQEIEQNEDLVMRLIFEECIEFVIEDIPPFTDLNLFPLTEEGEMAVLPSKMESFENHYHLLNERYVVIWGADHQTKACMLFTNPNSTAPALLGVHGEGFLDRVTRRAEEFGMTDVLLGETLNPLETNSWNEPGEPWTEKLRMTLLPTEADEHNAIYDIGLIMVAGGVGREPN